MNSIKLNETEYAPFYKNYISLLGSADLFEVLELSKVNFINSIKSIPENKLTYRYEESKWTIKEIIQHIIDAERIMSYRALRFSRNDDTDLPGFNEDYYVENSTGNEREINALLDEFLLVRNATLALFKSFSQSMLVATGTANNFSISVRALGFIIAGHQIHHQQVILSKYTK